MNGRARLLAAILVGGLGALAGVALDAADAADVSARINGKTLRVESKGANANITLRLRAGHKQQLVVDANSDGKAEFVFDRGKFTKIVLDGRLGNDVLRISETRGVFTNTEKTTILGGAGDDTIVGGSGAERLFGGPGADSIRGGRGPDSVFLGPDDDEFLWFVGDGKDTVEGQAGSDSVEADGSSSAESFSVAKAGTRLRLARNGARAVDGAGLEELVLRPLGGGDTVSVGDLTGTGMTKLDIAFGLSGGFVNQLLVSGTNGDDVTTLSGSSAGVTVNGLAAQIVVVPSAVTDVLRVNAIAGDDVIECSAVSAGAFSLILDGGDGDDVLIGSAGPDTAYGGAGDDVLIGGPGVDVLDGGAGSNVVIQD